MANRKYIPARKSQEEGRRVPADTSRAWLLALPEGTDYAALGSEPLHIFRLGPVYDRTSGEMYAEITDEVLAELARVFPLQRADGQTVPIDWAHGSEWAATPEAAGPMGEVLAVEHRPGEGMWATVAWTARGQRVVADGVPCLYTSPAYAGPCFSKGTGEKLGELYLRSIALTDRPRQDRLDPVRLSEDMPADAGKEPEMAKQKLAEPAPAEAKVPEGTEQPEAPKDEPKDLPEALAVIAALREELAALQAKHEEVMKAKEPEMEAEKGLAETSLAEIKSLSERLSLAEKQLAQVTAEKKAEALNHQIAMGETKGWWAPARSPFMKTLAEKAPELFAQEVKRLSDNPEIDLSEIGHGTKIEPKDPVTALDDEIKAMCEAKGWDIKREYNRAYRMIQAQNQKKG